MSLQQQRQHRKKELLLTQVLSRKSTLLLKEPSNSNNNDLITVKIDSSQYHPKKSGQHELSGTRLRRPAPPQNLTTQTEKESQSSSSQCDNSSRQRSVMQDQYQSMILGSSGGYNKVGTVVLDKSLQLASVIGSNKLPLRKTKNQVAAQRSVLTKKTLKGPKSSSKVSELLPQNLSQKLQQSIEKRNKVLLSQTSTANHCQVQQTVPEQQQYSSLKTKDQFKLEQVARKAKSYLKTANRKFRNASMLGDVVQAEKNLKAGYLLTSGRTLNKPLWKEEHNRHFSNLSEFLASNMKQEMNLTAEQRREASRLIRMHHHKQHCATNSKTSLKQRQQSVDSRCLIQPRQITKLKSQLTNYRADDIESLKGLHSSQPSIQSQSRFLVTRAGETSGMADSEMTVPIMMESTMPDGETNYAIGECSAGFRDKKVYHQTSYDFNQTRQQLPEERAATAWHDSQQLTQVSLGSIGAGLKTGTECTASLGEYSPAPTTGERGRALKFQNKVIASVQIKTSQRRQRNPKNNSQLLLQPLKGIKTQYTQQAIKEMSSVQNIKALNERQTNSLSPPRQTTFIHSSLERLADLKTTFEASTQKVSNQVSQRRRPKPRHSLQKILHLQSSSLEPTPSSKLLEERTLKQKNNHFNKASNIANITVSREENTPISSSDVQVPTDTFTLTLGQSLRASMKNLRSDEEINRQLNQMRPGHEKRRQLDSGELDVSLYNRDSQIVIAENTSSLESSLEPRSNGGVRSDYSQHNFDSQLKLDHLHTKQKNSVFQQQLQLSGSYKESLFSLKRNSADTEVPTPRLTNSKEDLQLRNIFEELGDETGQDAIGNFNFTRHGADFSKTVNLIINKEQKAPSTVTTSNQATRRHHIQSGELNYPPRNRLHFTRRHKSTMKGKSRMATELVLLRDDGSGDHEMRMQCKQAAGEDRRLIQNLVERLDARVKHEVASNHEDTAVYLAQIKRTRYELERALYYQFDVHKKKRHGSKVEREEDKIPEWQIGLDSHLERQKVANTLLSMPPSSKLSSISLDPEEGVYTDRQSLNLLDQTNKAGNIESQEEALQLIKKIDDAKHNLAPLVKSIVCESVLPLQLFYNKKIERIRGEEYRRHLEPSAIKFDFLESYTGQKSKKIIKLVAESSPDKPMTFQVDFANPIDNPRSFETKLERHTRGVKSKYDDPPILTDYTRGAKDNSSVGRFVQDLHHRVKIQERHEQVEVMKIYSKTRSDAEIHDKFCKKIVGMRRGKQFEFNKLERTEAVGADKDKNKKGDVLSVEAGLIESSFSQDDCSESEEGDKVVEEISGEVSQRHRATSFNLDFQKRTSQSKKSPWASQANSPTKQNETPVGSPKDQQDDLKIILRNSGIISLSDEISEAVSFHTKQQSGENSPSVKQKIKRQNLVHHMASLLEDDMRAKEALLGLTVARDFKSKYEQKKAERKLKAFKKADVSIYEGRVPLHQRLVLLSQDFMESTWEFEHEDLVNFQTRLQGLDDSFQPEKAATLQRLIKELFKKYQLEIIQPSLSYIIDKYKTAHELYIAEQVVNAEKSQKIAPTDEKSNCLIKFKHSVPVMQPYQMKYSGIITSKDKIREISSHSPGKVKHPTQVSKQTSVNEVDSMKSDDDLSYEEAFDSVPELSHNPMQSSVQVSYRHSNSALSIQHQAPIPPILRKMQTSSKMSGKSFEKQATVIARRNSILSQRRESSVGHTPDLLSDSSASPLRLKRNRGGSSDSSEKKESTVQDLRQELRESNKETWFARLNWSDEQKYQNFGGDKTKHQEVKIVDPYYHSQQESQKYKPSSFAAEIRSKKSHNSSQKLKQESILAVLAEESRKNLQDEFDHTKMREKVVKEKSMFKPGFSVKELFKTNKVMQAKIMGEDIIEDDQDKSI